MLECGRRIDQSFRIISLYPALIQSPSIQVAVVNSTEMCHPKYACVVKLNLDIHMVDRLERFVCLFTRDTAAQYISVLSLGIAITGVTRQCLIFYLVGRLDVPVLRNQKDVF